MDPCEGKASSEALPRRSRQQTRGVKKACQLPTLPFMRVSHTVTRDGASENDGKRCDARKEIVQSPSHSFDHLVHKRSHLVDSSDSSLDDRIGLLVSQRVTREGWSSDSTLDLINMGREDLPAPGKLRSRNKDKSNKRSRKQTGVNIYKHIAQLKQKQAKFDRSVATTVSNPALEEDTSVTREHSLSVSLRSDESIRLGLYDHGQSDIQLGRADSSKDVSENKTLVLGDQLDVTTTPSQQVPTNSPLLPNFLQQSSFVYLDSSTATPNVPTFYDQASLWMKTEDTTHRCSTKEYKVENGKESCCHVRSPGMQPLILSSGLDDSEGDFDSTLLVPHCGFARHEIED